MDPKGREDRVDLLLRHLATGAVPPDLLLGALRATAAAGQAPRPSRAALLRAVAEDSDPALAALKRFLTQRRLEDARAAHELRESGKPLSDDLRSELDDLPLDAPLERRTVEQDLAALRQALPALHGPGPDGGVEPGTAEAVERGVKEAVAALRRDLSVRLPPLALIESARARAPRLGAILGRVETRLRAELAEERRAADEALSRLPAPLPPRLLEAALLEAMAERQRTSEGRAERTLLLDAALSWPSDRIVPLVQGMCGEAWAQERAALVLTLRFGRGWGWSDWLLWLQTRQAQLERAQAAFAELAAEQPIELLLLWEIMRDPPDAEVVQGLTEWCGANLRAFPAAAVAERRGTDATQVEPAPMPAAPRPAEPSPPKPATPAPVVARAAPQPARPPVPSLWRDYVQSFLVENWYLVVGLLMVVAGSSLLAYFTWDKHWLLRYTIMPGLLGAFTAGLAGIARWLEARDGRFKGSGALLRGAAIGLLPVNFMAVALLSRDPLVSPPQKLVVVPIMAALYLVLFGWGLWTWCRSVHPGLGRMLGGTLLLLNALVVLGPVAQAVTEVRGDVLHAVLGVGFYLGFLALGMAVRRFNGHMLTAEVAADRRVPWFFGATLVTTYLQVFAWVHAFIRHLPDPETYAPLVILAGGLVLSTERRFLELRDEVGRHVGESFLGFAFVLTGVVMGMGHAEIRILAFVLAGLVWLRQAERRGDARHHAIGLVLLCLAGASVGLLPAFPRPWLGALGIGLALTLTAAWAWAERTSRPLLAEASLAIRQAVLFLTTGVAVLTQWHFRSEPLVTAALLLIIVAFFAAHARTTRNLASLLTACLVLAGALPYLGCVDVLGRSFHGNTMVFGLAVIASLWLALTLEAKDPVLLAARSTVLWLYGALALASMVLRVLAEGPRLGDALTSRAWLDYTGPLLMTAVLVVTAFLSRSSAPVWIASVILVVLFPELRAHLRIVLPGLTWGSGLGSALGALALTAGAFRLRAWPRLAKLEGGDLFLGREPFPLRHADASMFTTPAIASAVFLCAKVLTWNLGQNLGPHGELGLKTTAALGVIAVAWTLVAVFGRERRLAAVAVHLGWISAMLAIGFGLDHVPGAPGVQWTFVATGLLLQALELWYRALTVRRPWVESLLFRPTRGVLHGGALVLTAGSLIGLWQGTAIPDLWAVLVFLALQLPARGLLTGRPVYGASLFVLGWTVLLAWTAPGNAPLVDRLGVETSLTPTLWLCLAVQLLHLALELRPAAAARLRPLLWPWQLGATAVGACLGCLGMADAVSARSATEPQIALLLVATLLTARAHGSGLFALIGGVLGYLLAHDRLLAATPTFDGRIDLLLLPWRAAVFGLALAALGALGRAVYARQPRALVGSLGFEALRWPATPWLFVPATLLALFASLRHSLEPALREEPLQVLAPYAGAAALALVGWSWNQAVHFGLAAALLTLGNVHAVRVYLGARLRSHGLAEDHLVSLGIGATLVQGSLIRLAARKNSVRAAINGASLPLATLILVLLGTNYVVHPHLDAIPAFRFAISGSMALLASLYFRRAWLNPGPGEKAYVDVCASLYHFGVAVAIWCAALMVPWLRQPSTALFALGIPVLYFYARAELAFAHEDPVPLKRYRASAATLGFVLLGLYVFRAAFQMVTFPDTPILTQHYHDNAALLIVLAVVLLRLHALGGTAWLAFYGGLALVTGSYFALTALPGLSPFEAPLPAAWCALGMAHFWTVATYQRSPLRAAVQELAGIDATLWLSLRRSWGRCVLAAVHILVLLDCVDRATDSHAIAPLLLGTASVLVHQGLQREKVGYLIAAALEAVAALHADFLVPSYLKADDVVWVVVGLWAVFLVGRGFFERWALVRQPHAVAAAFALMTLGHVLYHHPSSTTGLWAFALAAGLGLLSPCPSRRADTAEATAVALLPLLVPTWLAFFSQAPLLKEGPPGALHAWALLVTAATILVTGAAALLYSQREARRASADGPGRLWHRTRAAVDAHGGEIRSVSLWTAAAMAAAVQLLHYERAFDARGFVLFLALDLGLVVSWFHEGRRRRSMLAYALAQLSVLALFLLVRRQLVLTLGFWTPEHDVWLSLLVSLGLTGAKPWIDSQPREARVPSTVSLLALPGAALAWTLVHHLGSDTTLLVIGLHSVMFGFLGREDRDSPYKLLAVGGFVAFVLIVFWTKLELRVLPAYVIPVGVGILALVQIFGPGIDPGTRNRVRAVAFLAMLASSGYSVLADERYPLAFHLTLLLLCLAGMGLGSFLRVRLYLVLGSTGVAADLAVIVLRALIHMDRGPRMTAVGLLVLLLGTGLVAGAIVYKTQRETLNERIDHWRLRLGEWE